MANKAVKHRMTGPGVVFDRSAKKSKLVVGFDPSPNGFVGECRRDRGRLTLTLAAPETGIDPIQCAVEPHAWKFLFENAAIPKDRLADLEFLITEESDIQVTIEYTPEAKLGDEP